MSKITELAEQIRKQSKNEQESIKQEVSNATKELIAGLNKELETSRATMLKSILGLNVVWAMIGCLFTVIICLALTIAYQASELKDLKETKATLSQFEKYRALKDLKISQNTDGTIIAIPISQNVQEWKTKEYHVIKIN